MSPSPTQVYVGTGSSVKHPHGQFKANDVQERSQFKFQNLEAEQVTELQSEIAALKRELLELRQEKADLEILLEATAEHSDSVEAELHNTAIAALKQSEEMFRTIAGATPVPILISRIEDGSVLYANTAATTAFGIPSEDFLNYSTLEFYHDPGDRQRLLAALECDGCVESFELQCKRADGSLFWVAASLRRLIFNDEPTFLTALCDITQRKLEEEALKRQVQEMQIEIDQAKRAKQVAEIVQSDYFQRLKAEVEQLRYSEEDC
ncbi:MAG: PAS domain S-box protein [Leptolyngbyaceae cyanobacterium SU_3_3]|nr:PAS domain S-box protein [Leptolyngbyaceae cyanobacterium SU_3_3]NJR49492.1 PAS domain S-box protein [Leptolyngbyaceae cyanobacterium CSU_1_3]